MAKPRSTYTCLENADAGTTKVVCGCVQEASKHLGTFLLSSTQLEKHECPQICEDFKTKSGLENIINTIKEGGGTLI